jgi:prevent-host-death family protein
MKGLARMPSYSVSEAKDNLSRLIDQAAEGQEVIITRHGKAAARISVLEEMRHAPRRAMSPEFVEKLRGLQKNWTFSEKSGAEWVREMRDEEPGGN